MRGGGREGEAGEGDIPIQAKSSRVCNALVREAAAAREEISRPASVSGMLGAAIVILPPFSWRSDNSAQLIAARSLFDTDHSN